MSIGWARCIACLVIVAICLVAGQKAKADTLTVDFNISADLGPLTPCTSFGPSGQVAPCAGNSSIGSLTLTLNPDGTISGHLVSSAGPIFLFGYNETAVAGNLLTYTGLPTQYSPTGLSGGGFSTNFNEGFGNFGSPATIGPVCQAAALCLSTIDFTVSGPSPFTSVSQFASLGPSNGGSGPAVQFFLEDFTVQDTTVTGSALAGANAPVPEPTTLVLLVSGIGGLLTKRLRRR